jgi:hypothetical protein
VSAEKAERWAGRAARLSDGVLDLVVLAFAAWTAVYHACLILGLGTLWAGLAWAAALVPCGWLAFRPDEPRTPGPEAPAPTAWSPRRVTLVLGVYAAAAAAAAAAFGLSSGHWKRVWLLLFATAAAGVVLAWLRSGGRLRLGALEREDEPAVTWPDAAVALAWAAGLATFSLFLVDTDPDDAQYVRLSTWIAEHGEFPLRDTIFSDQVFPAIIYPPVSSFEGLVGLVARVGGISGPNVAYLVVPPLAIALSVLAIWRLLRAWRAQMVGVALTTSMVFLIWAAQDHRTFGSFFVGRVWQGKAIFVALLVPLLFVLLLEWAERPGRRQGLLLFAAGAAGIGLTSSGTFLVPIVSAACLAPLALRAWRQAALGFTLAAAYPLVALATSVAVGGHRASVDRALDVVVNEIARMVLGSGWLAFVAVFAALAGPLALGNRRAAPMAAGTLLLVLVVYTPGVPTLVWETTGIGRILWRVAWLIPVAALVGVLATAVTARVRSPLLAAVPAVLVCVSVIVWGNPVWNGIVVKNRPSWKRLEVDTTAARRILDRAEPGDVVLAPMGLSQTVLTMSGDVTTVAPRLFYVSALKEIPAARVDDRLLLQSVVEPDLRERLGRVPDEPPSDERVAEALDAVGVDFACFSRDERSGIPSAEAAGFTEAFRTGEYVCLER